MSIKLLPASVNPVDPPDVSTSLVPLTQRAITMRAGQISLVPSTEAFAWSASTRRGGANHIDGTPVEDSQSDETGRTGWEYLSGWAWSHSVERTAIAHYLFYAAGPAGWSGRLIDLYA
ncbi:MAG TPA: hypothetical protein VN950_01675 [Terriglobales bacterium]|nr:hypothetical protein [Terriglobales bacterium]